jgi:hypothetical protein
MRAPQARSGAPAAFFKAFRATLLLLDGSERRFFYRG